MDLLLITIATLLIFLDKKIEWVLVIILLLATGYQNFAFLSNFNYLPNGVDGAILLTFLMYVKYYKAPIINDNKDLISIKKWLVILLVYLIITLVVDIVVNDIDIESIIRTSRQWLLLFLFQPLRKLQTTTLVNAVKYLFRITIIISLINVFEYFTGIHILTKTYVEGGSSIIRGALPPTLAYFFSLMVYGNAYKLSKNRKIVSLVILILGLLISSTRSILFAVVLGFAFIDYFRSSNKLKSVSRVLFVGIIAIVALSFMPSMQSRLDDMKTELLSFDNQNVSGNTSFRLLVLAERYDYLTQDPLRYCFGIGNVTEKNFRSTFDLGIVNEDNTVIQLDNGDTAWAILIIRIGIIGTILFLLFWYGYVKFVWSKNNAISIAFIGYLAFSILLLSFASSEIFCSYFFIVPFIVAILIKRGYYSI